MFRWLLSAALLVCMAGQARSDAPYLKEGPQTSTLIGQFAFCSRHPEACRPDGEGEVRLTPSLAAALAEVQIAVNSRVQPDADIEQYGKDDFWTYPESGKGDCEDYVLLKRKLLMETGWPGNALRLTVVQLDRPGKSGTVGGNTEYHLVLAAVTDEGTFILDNRRPNVEEWHETPNTYVKWTSAWSPRLWVELVDRRIDLRAGH